MIKNTCLAICALLMIAAARPCFAQAGLSIDQLGAAGALSDSDLIAIEQGGGPPAVKTTLGALRAYITTVITPAFYVATASSTPPGNDSNLGTLAAPFLTLGKCQTAMQVNGAPKVCYIRAGTFNLTSTGSGCDSGPSQALGFTNADAGETWSYYPPDGYNTAILDGGSTSSGTGVNTGFCLGGGISSPITFIGLQMQNFNAQMIFATSPVIITNNIFHDTHQITTNQAGAAIITDNNSAGPTVAGSVFSHNYVYNMTGDGVEVISNFANTTNNVSVSNNLFYNTCTNAPDCGAIYHEDRSTTTASTGISITNNYVRDVFISGAGNQSGSNNSPCIYLDDGATNTTVTGNICTGIHASSVLYHGGSTDAVKNNVFDYSTSTTPCLPMYQALGGFAGAAMTGNTYVNNAHTINAANNTFGYCPSGSPPAPLTVNNNFYENYHTGNSIVSTSTTGANLTPTAGADATPTNGTPASGDARIHCWGGIIGSGSPVFSAPVSFPAQPAAWDTPGFWGPPGFTVPHIGTAPSWSTSSGDGVTCTASN